MIILRQKEFGFFTPGKDAAKLWEKILSYEEYNDVDLPSSVSNVSPDFKCWLGFISLEITKKQQFIYGEKGNGTRIWIQNLDRVLKDNIVAMTEGSSGQFRLVYDKIRKIYQVVYGTMKAQFLSRAINRLFKEEDKVYYECKTVLDGLTWMRRNIITTTSYY